jgi:hypothetical protein
VLTGAAAALVPLKAAFAGRNLAVVLFVSRQRLAQRLKQHAPVRRARDDSRVNRDLMPFGIVLAEIEHDFERVVSDVECVRVVALGRCVVHPVVSALPAHDTA